VARWVAVVWVAAPAFREGINMRSMVLAAATVALVSTGCMTVKSGEAKLKAMLPEMTLPTVGGNAATPGAKGDAELPPDQAVKACLKTAEELEKGGFDADAAAQYERARQLDPNVAVSRRLAVLYDRSGQDARAAKEFEAALKKAPNDPGLLNDAGYFRACRGEWAIAERHLNQAIRIDREFAPAWTNLGVLYAKTGRTDEALRAFGQSMSPADAAANVSVLLAGQGKHDEARSAIHRAIVQEPSPSRLQELRAHFKQASERVVPTSPSGK